MTSRYCLRVTETVDPAWVAWLDNLTLTHETDRSTTLAVRIADQDQLFRLLHKMGELGMTLLAVEVMQETDCSVFHNHTERR